MWDWAAIPTTSFFFFYINRNRNLRHLPHLYPLHAHDTNGQLVCTSAPSNFFSLLYIWKILCAEVWDTQRETENTKCIHTWNQESRKVVISFVQRKFILCFFSVINGKSKKKERKRKKEEKKKSNKPREDRINFHRWTFVYYGWFACFEQSGQLKPI